MKPIRNRWRTRHPLRVLAAISLLGTSGVLAQDPDFVFDFNTDPGDALEIISNSDTTEWRSSGGVDDSGYLSLTDNVDSARAAIIFQDPTGGKPIEGLKFSVDCRIGANSEPNNPADGFSINIVRPSDPLLQEPRGEGYAGTRDLGAGEDNLPEEGSQTGLGIGFDAWFSGGTDVVGFSVRVDGELVDQVPAETRNGEPDDIESLQTGPRNEDDLLGSLTWQPFEIELTPGGELTIKWKGQEISKKQVEYFPGPGQVVFGARTGGENQYHHFDNLSLTILAAVKAVVSGLTFDQEHVQFEITDGEDSSLNPESVSLMIDGEPVDVEINKQGLVTTVSYIPDPPFEVASIHSYALTASDNLGNMIGRSGTISLPEPVFPFGPLPGAESDEGFFGTRYIWGGPDQITTTAQAIQVIQSVANGTWEGEFFDTLHETINFTGGGIFGDDLEYPEEVATSDFWTGDDFVQYSRGYVRFSEAGAYTFGVHSDDGFGLRVLGGPRFVSFDTGATGAIDDADPSALIHAAPTGDANTRGVLQVDQPGTYLLEFFWWERGGGDNGELYVSRGAISGGDDDENASWSLVGQVESVSYNIPGVDESGWTIEASAPGGDELGTLEAAIADLDAGVTTVEGVAVFNINDPQSGGPGTFPGDTPFPGNTDADDNDWAVRATAKLVIPASGEYQLGFRGDDGGQLKVAGQEFKEVVADATGSAVIEGDTVITDALTGDSNTIATIDLEAGSYDIEYIGFERGGGAYFEVFGSGVGAPGPVLLAVGGAGSGVLEPSVALVAPPAIRLPVVEFAREGDNVRIDFDALDASAEHIMETSMGLMDWSALETTVTVVDGNILSAVAPAGAGAQRYYRVRQLPPPAILEDSFEEDLGWTVDAGVWERGAPAGSLSSALTGENVYATSLADGYPGLSNTGLRSPLLDLTGATAPRLQFFYNQTMGEEEGVRLDFLDENGDPLFDSDIILTGDSGGWVEFNRPFPAEAREQKVFIEFRLLTDDDDSNDGFGFALDDVLVK